MYTMLSITHWDLKLIGFFNVSTFEILRKLVWQNA